MHPLVTHQTDLQAGKSGRGFHQGNKAGAGEVHMADAIAGLGQRFGKYQFDAFALFHELHPILAREQEEQLVGGRCSDRV